MSEKGGLFSKWHKRYLFEYLAALFFLIAANALCIPQFC
jgi:hypothetical protein